MSTETQQETQVEDRGDDFTPEGSTPAAAATAAPVTEAELPPVQETAPAAESAKEEPKAEEPKKPIMVPKSRLDEVLAKNRELEQRVKQQEAQRAPAKEGELTLQQQLEAARDKYEDAMFDGDKSAAKAVRAEISKLEEALRTSYIDEAKNAATTSTQGATLMDQAISTVEEMYPALNPDSPDFNEEATAYALGLLEKFKRAGDSDVAALASAAELTAAKFGFAAGKAPETAAPETAPAPVDKAAERKQAAIAKAVAASNAQAPALNTTGLNHDTAGGAVTAEAVAKMGQKEFDKLAESSPEVLARLRGDVV